MGEQNQIRQQTKKHPSVPGWVLSMRFLVAFTARKFYVSRISLRWLRTPLREITSTGKIEQWLRLN